MTKYNVQDKVPYTNPEIKYLGPPDYEINKYEGYLYGRPLRRPQFVLLVDDSDGTAKMFKRNMVHNNKSPERWLVAECRGVRLYCADNGLYVLSHQDIYSSKNLVDMMAAGEFQPICK